MEGEEIIRIRVKKKQIMIGYLKGKIHEVDGNNLILLVGNVGYRVNVGKSGEYHSSDEEIELYIHTHVREDELSLYGFGDRKALKMFELLIGVSGVGPKMAMNVLGKGSAEQIQKAVALADVSFFTSVSGIGKKNGQRIIVDLKSKLGDLADLDLGEDEGGDELVQALVGMGFLRKDVMQVLSKLEPGLSEDEKIKQVISRLGKR